VRCQSDASSSRARNVDWCQPLKRDSRLTATWNGMDEPLEQFKYLSLEDEILMLAAR
jgi:hypothetical protein